MRRSLVIVVVLLLGVPLILGTSRRRAVSAPSPPLDMRRSFAVTDHVILDGFPFERVMNALVERSGVAGLTPTRLYQQWLDTQNPKPGLAVPDGPHCDDFLIDGRPSFNGFPRRCPTPEGILATTNPFTPPQFVPIGIINRFDMSAANGSNCGQYRLIYARKGEGREALHFIFEGVLPNPSPASGITACRPVAQFWADLSGIASPFERRARLEQFFFNGIPGFAPVVHPDHYGSDSGGGIRSFQWTSGKPRFYQFRLEKSCDTNACRLTMQPDVLQNMPMAKLLDARITTAQARRFRDNFIQQVETLALADRNRYFMNVGHEFLMVESDPVDDELTFLFVPPFVASLATSEGLQFVTRIAAELKRVGSPLQPAEVIYRAESLTCYGCHASAAVILSEPVAASTPPPPIALLQHVSEKAQEPGDGGPRYKISRAMRDNFIPHRMDVLRKFLASGTPPVHTNAAGQAMIGGDRTVQ